LIVNRLRPEAMQRRRLDVVDKPRMIPPLPGTGITPVAPPHCTAGDEASA
jgi:epsilon-lactone hydrolase